MSFNAVMFDGLGAAKRKREKKMAKKGTVRVSATVKCIGKGRKLAVHTYKGPNGKPRKMTMFVGKGRKCGSTVTIEMAKPFSSTFQPKKRRVACSKARKGQTCHKLVRMVKA